MKQFAKSDSRIRMYDNQGVGVIDALRTAYIQSTGDYITRMDADDLMPPKKLDLLLGLLQKPKQLATGAVRYFSGDVLGAGYIRYQNWLNAMMAEGNHYSQIYKECVIPSPAWLIHRVDLDACGAFDSDRYPEDYDLCFRFYKHNIDLRCTTEIVHLWRDHPQRFSRNSVHYADNRFLDIKLDYFLDIDYRRDDRLILWGAGRKGKIIAKRLIEEGIAFEWICNNPNKIGREIYGVRLQSIAKAGTPIQGKYIITPANPEVQAEIYQAMRAKGNTEGKDYYFFS